MTHWHGTKRFKLVTHDSDSVRWSQSHKCVGKNTKKHCCSRQFTIVIPWKRSVFESSILCGCIAIRSQRRLVIQSKSDVFLPFSRLSRWQNVYIKCSLCACATDRFWRNRKFADRNRPRFSRLFGHRCSNPVHLWIHVNTPRNERFLRSFKFL
jgi:hypothetical protein